MKKNLFRILIDITMFVVLTVLTFWFGTDLLIHEILGIAMGVLFILHFAIDFKMLKGIFKQVLNNKCKIGKKIALYLDIALCFAAIISCVSGILVSRELFNFSYSATLSAVHSVSSYICFGIVALHVLMHLKFISAVVRNAFSSKNLKSSVTYSIGYAFAIAAISILCVLVPIVTDSKQIVENNANSEPPENSFDKEDIYSQYSSSYIYEPSKEQGEKIEQKNEESSEIISSSQGQESSDVPTLNEFLSNMYCSGCGKHCSLLSPRCGKSSKYIEQAKLQYEEKYNISLDL